MLVLARRKGEEIVIGANIIVKVTSICGRVVRLGIDAPREVRIQRGEVHDGGEVHDDGEVCTGRELRRNLLPIRPERK